MSDRPSVMIVDDLPANLRLMARMLRNESYQVRPFPSGQLALTSARQDPPDLIVLDISMPEMDGYEVCRQIKASEALMDIPIIFLSALDDNTDKVRAFQAGGVDYITKPFQLEEIRARISTHLTRRQLERELGARTSQLNAKHEQLLSLMAMQDGLLNMLEHDVHGALSAILSGCGALTPDSSAQQVAATLATARSDASRLSERVRVLLDVQRLESGSLPLSRADIQPAELLRQSLTDLPDRETASRVVVTSTPCQALSCDVTLMKRALGTLLDNAWRFSPEAAQILLHCQDADGHVQFAITDRGPGIAAEHHERIFEKFTRIEQGAIRHSGGLGLTFCRLVIEAHGGTIGVEPGASGGSRFFFSLPC